MSEKATTKAWKEKVKEYGALMWKKPVKRWIISAVCLNLFIEIWNQQSIWKLLAYIFGNPLVFLYNTMLLMVPLSFAFLFKKRDFVHILMCTVCALLGLTNGIVLICRVTPFNATDFRLAKLGLSLATSYLKWWMIIAILVGLVIVMIGLVIVWRKTPKRTLPIPRYQILIAVVIFTFATAAVTQIATLSGVIVTQFPNLRNAYKEYGMPYCFTCSVLDTGISKPDNYNPEEVDTIIQDVDNSVGQDTETVPAEEEVVEEKKRPNIVFIQLESFFDITEMNNLELNEDPIPNFHRLQEEYSSGLVSVPAVGAGTANTEFEMITGMDLDFFGPGEYPYKTVLQTTTCESIANVLRDLGYTSHTLHNNTATFYDRNLVFSQLGFDTFTSIEYMNNLTYTETGWAKDKVLTSQIRDILRSTEGQAVIYGISVQGHGAYPEEAVIEDPVITVDGLESEAQTNQYTYYVNQIHEMDQFVQALVDMLEGWDEDCILVMYGDHLPTLGIEDEMLDGADVFQTPYFIWDNMGLEKEDRDLEAYQMYAWVLNKLDIHEGIMAKFHQSWFDRDLDEMLETDPNDPTDPQITAGELYLEKRQTLEYDILYGDHETTGGENPFKATDLQMGVRPITIRSLANADSRIYVGGENFTTDSKIYIGDEEQETIYVSPWLLATALPEDAKVGDELTISVKQIGRSEKVILSSTEESMLTITEKEQQQISPGAGADPFYQSEETETETETAK